MRKHLSIKLSVILMALTLITSSFVGGTFAKYVTAKDAADSARVAKFGVVITGTGETFATTYLKDDSSFTVASNTVNSADKVVAPGTKGTMAAFSIAGTPEVAVNVAFTATSVDFGDNWKDASDAYYCPIEVTVGSSILVGTTYENIEAFEAAIVNAVATFNKNYAAGTDLSTISSDAPVVSWEWKFAGNDVKDTFLGDQAATATAANLSIEITAAVTQID